MKILSNQPAKAARMASNSLPKDFPNDLLLLSPYARGILPKERSSDRERHIAIATENLKFLCGIRQDGGVHNRFMNCFENRKTPLSDALNLEDYQVPSLYDLLQSGYGVSDTDGPSAASKRLQDIRPMTTAQTREYRKSISLKLGSLNLSLDLVMVVKSKSSPKSVSRSGLRGVNFSAEDINLLMSQNKTTDILKT